MASRVYYQLQYKYDWDDDDEWHDVLEVYEDSLEVLLKHLSKQAPLTQNERIVERTIIDKVVVNGN